MLLGVMRPSKGNCAGQGAAERRGITLAVEEINGQRAVLDLASYLATCRYFDGNLGREQFHSWAIHERLATNVRLNLESGKYSYGYRAGAAAVRQRMNRLFIRPAVLRSDQTSIFDEEPTTPSTFNSPFTAGRPAEGGGTHAHPARSRT